MKVLCPPLADAIRQLFAEANTDFVIVSPWIKNDALRYVLGQDSNRAKRCRVLTVGDLKDFLKGSSDIAAIEWLLEAGADVRLISNLHAKIYLAGRIFAIVASANLTSSGLEDNLEFGVLIDNFEEIIVLVQIVEEWFSKGKRVDVNWLHSMQQALTSNRAAGVDLKQVDLRLTQAGDDLRGQRITLLKPEQPVRKVLVAPRPTVLRDEWSKKIGQWHHIESNPELAREFIRFFQLAFEWLPDRTLRQAWFGVHSDRISLTVGNIWLASIWTSRRTVWILVDISWDELAKSTQRYTPLGWKVGSWEQIFNLNRSPDIWKSYAAAAEKIWASPISGFVINKNLANKQKICDLLGITDAHPDSV
jgi:HKD family nuclease